MLFSVNINLLITLHGCNRQTDRNTNLLWQYRALQRYRAVKTVYNHSAVPTTDIMYQQIVEPEPNTSIQISTDNSTFFKTTIDWNDSDAEIVEAPFVIVTPSYIERL